MFDLILMSLNSLLIGVRSRAAMQAEIIALRHQLTCCNELKIQSGSSSIAAIDACGYGCQTVVGLAFLPDDCQNRNCDPLASSRILEVFVIDQAEKPHRKS